MSVSRMKKKDDRIISPAVYSKLVVGTMLKRIFSTMENEIHREKMAGMNLEEIQLSDCIRFRTINIDKETLDELSRTISTFTNKHGEQFINVFVLKRDFLSAKLTSKIRDALLELVERDVLFTSVEVLRDYREMPLKRFHDARSFVSRLRREQRGLFVDVEWKRLAKSSDLQFSPSQEDMTELEDMFTDMKKTLKNDLSFGKVRRWAEKKAAEFQAKKNGIDAVDY